LDVRFTRIKLGEWKLSIPLGELDFLGLRGQKRTTKNQSLSIPLGELDFLGLMDKAMAEDVVSTFNSPWGIRFPWTKILAHAGLTV